jgi:hypothetical protein
MAVLKEWDLNIDFFPPSEPNILRQCFKSRVRSNMVVIDINALGDGVVETFLSISHAE